MGQPDLMAGADFGGHGGEFQRQILDQDRADRGLQLRRKLVATDQARAVEADIEIAENISRLQAARPFFKRIEMPGRIGAANHRADRSADHDIGDDAMGNQRPHDPDMGKSTRGAAAQRQPDHRPPDAAKPYLVAAVRAVLTASDQNIQHRYLLGAEGYSLLLDPATMYHKHGLCRVRGPD